jgi:hypothetical protein
MGLKDTLDMLKDYPNVQAVVMHQDGGFEISFFESKSLGAVEMATVPKFQDMPPDDVMLFAATEDVDDLMKQRNAE